MLEFLGETLLGLAVGYFCGAFPTGYFVGRLHGVDVRQHGSGRTGGSNVLRTVGWFAFALTVTGDALKGALPVLLVAHLLARAAPTAAAAAVVGVLLGNNWSIVIAWLARTRPRSPATAGAYEFVKAQFARAKGGAGVVTTAAAALTVYWQAVVPLVVVGLAVLLLFRFSSVASMTVAALYPFVMAYFVLTGAAPNIYLPMSIIAAAIVLYVLIPNLKRLRAGTEQRFGQRVSPR